MRKGVLQNAQVVFCQGKKDAAQTSFEQRLLFVPVLLKGKRPRGPLSDGTGNLIGTQATGAGVNVTGRTVHDRLYALDVGLPGSVGTPMGVRNLDAKHNCPSADIAFAMGRDLLFPKNPG